MRLRAAMVVVLALGALVGARAMRGLAIAERSSWPKIVDEPYAPDPESIAFVSLGYRELLADLLWFRTVGYFGGSDDTPAGIYGLVHATVAADPSWELPYSWGATMLDSGTYTVTQEHHLASLDLLLRAHERFPDNWRHPYIAGQIYAVDLKTDDPAVRRTWDENAVRLMEKAIRMPGAPPKAVEFVMFLHTRLGRFERAVANLRELVLITDSKEARAQLLQQLAELEQANAQDLAIEMLDMRDAFVRDWRDERPAIPASMYLLLGERRDPYRPASDFAVDRDLVGTEGFEPLEPLTDP